MMLQYFKQIFLDFLESSSSSLLTTTPAWHQSWAAAMVAEPYSVESISARLSALLDGKTVGDATGISIWEGRRSALESFVQNVDWTFKPEAFDAVWHAVFKVAKRLGCTEKIRDATYYWTENFLLYEAIDAIPPEPGDTDSDSDLLPDGYDNTWISAAVGDARLFALGYGYSAFAWNAFLDGLGLGGEDINSDSMRIGSCGQLLGAGQRLKFFIYGGASNSYKNKGVCGPLPGCFAGGRGNWRRGVDKSFECFG